MLAKDDVGLLFTPEDGGDMFLQNIDCPLTECMALHPKKRYSESP
jgi:hypothetical protein